MSDNEGPVTMEMLPGYEDLQLIYTNTVVSVYRGRHRETNRSVILKTLTAEFPDQKDIARFKHEFNLLKELTLPDIIRIYNLEKYQNRYTLVLEDFAGSSLSSFLEKHLLNIEEFLTLAITLVHALQELHNANIIHKDINPSNILISEDGKHIKLIDFSIATQLSGEELELKNPDVLEGTLAYISPEQTSRMNRSIDHHTDFYSLGVTFYQILTGQLPFHAQDAMEWVHCHIAKQPKPPHEIRAEIPLTLSAIIMKMMAKAAEDRYNTAYGLAADLEQCLEQWRGQGDIPFFKLGQQDRATLFKIPEKLYGREAEVQQLLETFDRVSQGSHELLLVSGYAGIGKSSLVNEVQKPIIRQRGYFAMGKFQQFQSHIPYSAIISALQNLIQQILTENQRRIEVWRELLLNALGPNAQVMVEVIPALELLIGKQPPVIELSPSESRNRFELVFCDFIQIFAQSKHPLVLFLDDLQWADSASLNLLTQLLLNKSLTYFLLIGNYRDNEVKMGHPLLDTLETLDKAGVSQHHVVLKPLTAESLQQLINDTLYTTLDTRPLTQLVLNKTGGNPFFVNAFLTTLHQDKHISFDKARREWIWNIDILESLSITDNVVDLLESKIAKLPPETQEVLKIAACIGNRFDLATLCKLYKQTASELAKILWPAMQGHFILSQNENYKLAMADSEFNIDKLPIWYQFSHDRVQQAANSLLSESQTKLVHLKLGRILLSVTSAQQEETLFDIVSHFNRCLDLLTSFEEKIQVAKLNLHAAQKARLSAAYAASTSYFENVINLMGKERAWGQYPDIAFAMYVGFAECQHLLGKFKEADHYFEQIMRYVKKPLERGNIRLLQMQSYTVQQQYDEAIDSALDGLKILGITLSKHPKQWDLLKELLKLKFQLRHKKISELLDLPTVIDPEKKLAFDILQQLAVACYLQPNPQLMVLKTLRAFQYHLKYGNSASAASSYAYFGVMQIIYSNNIEKAYELSVLATKLVEKYENTRTSAYALTSTNLFINHWKIPYKKLLPQVNRAYQYARQAGDLLSASFTVGFTCYLKLLEGSELKEILQYIKKIQSALELSRNSALVRIFNSAELTLTTLTGTTTPQYFQQQIQTYLKDKKKLNIPPAHSLPISSQWLFTAYTLRNITSALEIIADIKKNRLDKNRRIQSYYLFPELMFLFAITYIAAYPTANITRRWHYWNSIKLSVKKFKKWEKHCPENFRAKYQLMLCGMCLLRGNTNEAIQHYEECIASARNSGLIQVEGYAHEMVARYFLNLKQPKSAKAYLQEACYAFQQWGAQAKVTALYTEFPGILGQQVVPSIQGTRHTQSMMSMSLTGSVQVTQMLDLATVMKSTQAISSHVRLEDLLRTLIKIVIENAGAERGILLLVQDEQLIVQAEAIVTDPTPKVMQNEPLLARSDLCFAIVQHVQRIREPVVLADATNKGAYTEDPYILQYKPLSILCMPILHQARLVGVLYLENNLARDAFTSNRIEILRLLSSQVAISLENARLYAAYDQFVPHEFLDLLGKRSIVDIRLGDHVQKDMAVLFSDIRNFTKMSEQMSPTETFQFMNEYLGYMEPIIKENGGFIDKYIGDAIMALFPRSAESAVTAGITMQQQLTIYNQGRASQGLGQIKVGIGINSGSLMLGTLGSTHRLETSVISDAVNVAARIQELTKEYDSHILIGDPVYFQLKEPGRFACRFVCRSQVRGKQQKTNIWEVYASDSEDIRLAKQTIAGRYDEAVVLYYQGYYEDALPIFEECLAKLPNDKVLQMYIGNCHSLINK